MKVMRSCRLARWLGLKRWREHVSLSVIEAHWGDASKDLVLEVYNELVDDVKGRLDN